MKKAVIYARVSSQEQKREGFSIDAQIKLLREYASKQNFEVVKEFIDVETAKHQGRKNFSLMLKFFESEKTLEKRQVQNFTYRKNRSTLS